MSEMKVFKKSFLILVLFFLVAAPNYAQQVIKYSIVVDSSVGEKVEYGLSKFENALKTKGILPERVDNLEKATGKQIVVVGLSTGKGTLAQIARTGNRSIPVSPEALAIWKETYNGKSLLALGGYDDQGVMYALQEAALRTEWGSNRDPFEYINEIVEKPEIANRAISMYAMNRKVWEQKFFDKKYWEKYFDMLSQNRFNSFVFIFGYENGGFLSPVYPYFFDVPGYPDVYMVGLTKEQQQRNLSTLNDIINMAHQRGIKITLGSWDHIFRGGVNQIAGIPGLEKALIEPTEGLVWGITLDNLIPYTKAALTRFIEVFPTIDCIEFRMHWEAGIENSEQETFWKDIFKTLITAAPHLNYVLRAKDLPDVVVQVAVDEGLRFRIDTKYWMEQMGMPWHPTHINMQDQMNRRHGYADMLRYPQDYKVNWKMWTGGTIRVLTWGSPDYARRFVESAKLYNGDTYEVNEPLATKMNAMPTDIEPFELLNPKYKYYEYEFERYWHFYQVFGRLGYNFYQSPDIWRNEFRNRFGKAAPYLEQAIHQASWILPRIVASSYPYGAFPTTRGWAEKQVLGTLPDFAASEGSDIQIFANFDEEAQLLIEPIASTRSIRQSNLETAKLLPSINSFWFKEQSESINELIRNAENAAGRNQSNEFKATITDLKILSNLALYHSRRIPAAVSYRIFSRIQNIAALDKAIEYEKNAIQAWKQIVEAAGDVYSKTLNFGVQEHRFGGVTHHLRGHWSDELVYLETGLAELEKQRAEFKPESEALKAPEYQVASHSDNNILFDVDLDIIESAPVNKTLTVRAKVKGVNGVQWVKLRYRSMNQMFEYNTLQMALATENDIYEAIIPVQDINPRFDLMYFIEVMDTNGNGKIYPDMNIQTPYVVVRLIR